MESETTGSEHDPAGDLDDILRARAAIAELLVTPWWYLPILGAALAAPAVGLGIGLPQGALLCVLGLVASLALTVAGVRRTGVRYAGSVRGPHERWLLALVGVLLVAYVTALAIGATSAPTALLALPALAVLALTITLGRRYERSLAANLRAAR